LSGAVRRRFAGCRWHFQHGPIDCILAADGDAAAVAAAVESAWARFEGVLAELVAELPLLRTDLSSAAGAAVAPRGGVARRMVAACRPHATEGRFITAMAAVAGSVAEELIGHFEHARIERAYVNNGGDIALHLAAGATFDVGIVADLGAALAAAAPAGRFRVDAAAGVRGIATSGWRGRSLSFGIADSATVLAASASAADAAATVVANAVNVDDARIRRAPADRLRDDSDLGARLVTCDVPALPAHLVEAALDAGRAQAEAECAAGRAVAAALCLQGRVRTAAARAAFDTLGSSLRHAARIAPPPCARATTHALPA
jgi:ApbE superfamily uncharacterized protein (UPF0280 family)